MESKTLYSNTEVCLTAMAVLPVEITCNASASPVPTDDGGAAVGSSSPATTARAINRASWRDAAFFLAPAEALRCLLFIGDARGTLRSLRLTIERAATTATSADAHLCTVESHRTVGLTPTPAPAPAANVPSDSSTVDTAAVSFLSVAPYAPFLVVAVVGGTLCALSALSFDVLRGDAFWQGCAALVRTSSSSSAPLIRVACEAMSQHDEASAAPATGRGPSHPPAHCVGVVTAQGAVVLLAFTASRVTSLGTFTPPDGVCTLAWVRSAVVVCGLNGTLHTYDAVTQQLRYRTATNTFTGVLPTRLPVSQQPLLHYLAPCAGPKDGAEDARAGLSWGPAFLTSRRDGRRTLCYAEAPSSLPPSHSSGADQAGEDTFSAALRDPAHALPCPSSVVDLTCLSPFLLGQTQAGLVLQSTWDGRTWLSGPANTTTFTAKEARTMAAMPMGALVLAPHAIEAHILLPFSVQVDRLIESQWYAKAEWFARTCAPPTEATSLDELYQSLASHAWAHEAYEAAFDYFHKAGTPLQALLSLLPELSLPSLDAEEEEAGLASPAKDDSPLTAHFTTCASAGPYESLYPLLKAALLAWETAENAEEEDDDDADGAAVVPNVARETVEYALYLLLVCLPRERALTAPVPSAEAASVLLLCRTLPLSHCLQLATAPSSAAPPLASSELLTPFLYAACGELSTALDVCRRTGAVQAAGWILQSAPVATDALYVTHLPWMLATDAARTASVLTAPHVCPPAVPTVVALVAGSACEEDVLLDYLHHCVYAAPTLHQADERAVQTAYALHLIDRLHDMRDALTMQALAPANTSAERGTTSGGDRGGLHVPAGAEAGFLGVCHRLLLAFLDRPSACYDEALVLARLHASGLFAEKAKVQAHLRDHLGVLETLVYHLDQVDAAIRYCLAHGEAGVAPPAAVDARSPASLSDEGMRGEASPPLPDRAHEAAPPLTSSHSNPLLLTLLQLLLASPAEEEGSPSRMADALHLLATHAPFLNPLAVLDILPGELPLSDVEPYLLRTFQTTALQTELVELEAAATVSAMETARRLHVRLEQRCAWVAEDRACALCRQPLSNSTAQWVFPDLKVAHFHCIKNPQVEPERRTAYRVLPTLS